MKYEVYVFVGNDISYIDEYQTLEEALKLVNKINDHNDPMKMWAMWKCKFEKGI